MINNFFLNPYIDHTLLRPDATQEEITNLCEEARHYHFATVCINPCWLEVGCHLLQGSDVRLCTVIGFPLGANTTETKIAEAKQAVYLGAQEIDMVLNVGALKSRDYVRVEEDVHAVVNACSPHVVKVILETCLLTDEEKKIACQLCVKAGAHFVKTSTGFSKAGATVNDVALLRKAVGPGIGVKASGGIATRAFALQLIEAGASRIGTSRGVSLVDPEAY